MSASVPLDGRRMCGHVCMRTGAPPVMTTACHFTDCGTLSARTLSLTATTADKDVQVIGEIVIEVMQDDSKHASCQRSLKWSMSFIESLASERFSRVRRSAVRSFDWFPGAGDDGALVQA
jgi:hypothetical protein